VNNKQRVNYQLRDEQWTVKLIAVLKKRFVSLSTSVSVTSISRSIRLNKAEALINSQCTLASTLRND